MKNSTYNFRLNLHLSSLFNLLLIFSLLTTSIISNAQVVELGGITVQELEQKAAEVEQKRDYHHAASLREQAASQQHEEFVNLMRAQKPEQALPVLEKAISNMLRAVQLYKRCNRHQEANNASRIVLDWQQNRAAIIAELQQQEQQGQQGQQGQGQQGQAPKQGRNKGQNQAENKGQNQGFGKDVTLGMPRNGSIDPLEGKNGNLRGQRSGGNGKEEQGRFKQGQKCKCGTFQADVTYSYPGTRVKPEVYKNVTFTPGKKHPIQAKNLLTAGQIVEISITPRLNCQCTGGGNCGKVFFRNGRGGVTPGIKMTLGDNDRSVGREAGTDNAQRQRGGGWDAERKTFKIRLKIVDEKALAHKGSVRFGAFQKINMKAFCAGDCNPRPAYCTQQVEFRFLWVPKR